MDFRIINNGSRNHLTEVVRLLKGCSDAVIASPFMTKEAVDKMFGSTCNQLKNLTVITTLKVQDFDQLKKVPVLLYLYSLSESKSISLTIRIDNNLHGKIYVGLKDGIYKRAIVSSANLTGNGLEKHHEWGVYLNTPDSIREMCEQVLKDSEYEINKGELERMNDLIVAQKLQIEVLPQTRFDLVGMVKPSQSVNRRGITWWLKPFGTLADPVPFSEKFDQDSFEVSFAKSIESIKEGDILIAYAVKSQKIIAIYVATAQRGKRNKNQNWRYQRWPYFVKCNNLTTRFGANWSSINLTLNSLIESYLKDNPVRMIHHSSNNLAVMRRGLDRLRLEKDFAAYVVDMVMKRNV